MVFDAFGETVRTGSGFSVTAAVSIRQRDAVDVCYQQHDVPRTKDRLALKARKPDS
jgi:hypothetical protein